MACSSTATQQRVRDGAKNCSGVDDCDENERREELAGAVESPPLDTRSGRWEWSLSAVKA